MSNTHFVLGWKECQEKLCQYGCDVVNNELVCSCPDYLVQINKTNCEGNVNFCL